MADKHANLQRIDPYTDTFTGTGQTIYYGYATPGTQDTQYAWSLRKGYVTSGGVLQYQYPFISGTTWLHYNLSWNLRTGYTYR